MSCTTWMGVPDLHPLLIQDTPLAVQLVNICLRQAAPILAQVVNVQISDVLLVSAQLLKVCTYQVPVSHSTKTSFAGTLAVPCASSDMYLAYMSSLQGHMGFCQACNFTVSFHESKGHQGVLMPAIHASKRLTISAISSLK